MLRGYIIKYIKSIFLVIFLNQCDLGIDGGGVIRAKDAYKKIREVLTIKINYCIEVEGYKYKSFGFSYKGLPGWLSCPDGNTNVHEYYYQNDIDVCLNRIQAMPCLPSDSMWDTIPWSICKFNRVHIFNARHPMQGNIYNIIELLGRKDRYKPGGGACM